MLDELSSFIAELGQTVVHGQYFPAPCSASLIIHDEKIVIHKVSNIVNESADYLRLICQANGDRLIAIHTEDWDRNSDAVKARLHVVFHTGGRVHADRTKIEDVPLDDAKDFFNQYHPSGFPRADEWIDHHVVGLTKGGEFVAMMLFASETVCDHGDYLECYVTKGTVIGGAKKLFDYYRTTHSKPETEVYADCDLNWETGGLYYTLGFAPDCFVKPEEHWQCGWTKFILTPKTA